MRNGLPVLTHQFVGQFCGQYVTASLSLCLDELAAVIPFRPVYQRGHNTAADAFAIADNGCLCLGAEVANQEHALIDAAQLFKMSLDNGLECLPVAAGRNNGTYHVLMTLHNLQKCLLVNGVASLCLLGCLYQLICNSAQGTDNHNDGFGLGLNNLLYIQNTIRGTYGCSAKFQYFHTC